MSSLRFLCISLCTVCLWISQSADTRADSATIRADSATIRLAPGTWHGTARVRVVVAADGTQTVTVDMSQPITITGGGSITPPVDPPDPPPADTPLEKFRGTVRSETAKITDPAKAGQQAAVAKLYAAIAGLPVTSRDQLTQATDAMWGLLGLPPAWQGWKVAVDRGLVQFKSLDEARTAWKVVAEAVQ